MASRSVSTVWARNRRRTLLILEKAFSIGATRQDDTIAGFSSRGPVANDSSGRLKPNVSAPGVGVISSVPQGGYASFSGTSMSGPHVAGVVALMISANPQLAGQVDTIERIIELTAKPMKTTQDCGISGQNVPNNTYGWGRIDAVAAVKKGLLYRPRRAGDPRSIIVYPNPFESEIRLDTEGVEGETIISIFNMNGHLMYSNTLYFREKQTAIIPLKHLSTGIYLYKIQNKNINLTGKIVKI